MARASSSPLAVLGGGPVGWLAALMLARRLPGEAPVRIVTGRRAPPEDGRAAALVGRSMDILDELGLEPAFRSAGAPLAAIRIVDATGRLFRAPTVTFRAADMGETDFGVSLLTPRIVGLLGEAARAEPRVEVVEAEATAVARAPEGGWEIALDDGRSLFAPFLVAADGQRSLARDAAGIRARQWSYPQAALTFAVRHARDHDDVSTEFHTAEGPFTLVPNGARRSTVVWMTRPARAEALMGMDDARFAREAERTCGSLLGRLELESPRGSYPMRGLLADRFAAEGVALVGETGHAFPPIGAQGLNLGFRDVDTLSRALSDLAARGADPAQPEALAAWDRGRRRDAGLRTAGVDALNRALLLGLPPLDLMRSLALAALDALGPARRAAMRLGMARR